MLSNNQYNAGLYLRLSKDDEQSGESVSIGTQRAILADYCAAHQFPIYKEYIDDGYSGLNFDRPGFQELLRDVESGVINMVLTKDLSRLGRDYIMTGYYTEIFFQAKGVRYIALADDVDSLNGINEIAPFKNILNDMYARDISKKVKNAKHQRAKQGLFIGSQTPYGYQKDPDSKNHMIVDPEAAEVVRTIFSMAQNDLGSNSIANELRTRRIPTPAAYKFQRGDSRYGHYPSVKNGTPYEWSATTVGQILCNPVYTGTLFTLKKEVINYKTKQTVRNPIECQIVTPNAHEAIISPKTFDEVQAIRAGHACCALNKRFNLFRGKLFCECCGHPLMISKKQLLYRDADIYQCMYHYRHPEVCPKTHRVYHEMLYPYVLQQIRLFAKSMKRRKVHSAIAEFATIEELSEEVLDKVIDRIEVGHVKHKSKPGNVIHIYWKLS